MKRKVLYYILSVICLVASSCVRDDVDSAGGMSEGECIVSAAVDFKPLTAGLDGGTRTAGDAVKSIDNLCVLFYDNDNKLVQTCYLEEGEGGYTLSEEERTGSGIAERTTPRATFRMKVAYGSYRIYVAANMGDLSAQEKYAEAIKTVDGLKSIRLGRGDSRQPRDVRLLRQWRPVDLRGACGRHRQRNHDHAGVDTPLRVEADGSLRCHRTQR